MQYARDAGADGFCTYSYNVTNDGGVTWTDWYPYIAANLFTSPVPIPEMPWRDPATATEGTLYGQVTDVSTGDPVDDATVEVGSLGAIQTDGNGYYVATLIPATAGGTAYSVTASATGYGSTVHNGVTVVAGDVRREDLALSAVLTPDIAEVIPDPATVTEGQEYTVQLQVLSGTVDTWTLLTGPTGAQVSQSGFVSGWTPSAGDVGSTFDFSVEATNTYGSDVESWQVQVEAYVPCQDAPLGSGFEGYEDGIEVLFQHPLFSGTTDEHLELDPDVAAVSGEVTAYEGVKCYKLQWQFVDGTAERWLRATTSNADNVPNPTIELDRPIRVRLRLEAPPGSSLLVALGVRETGTTAEVGQDGGTAGTIEWVGADSAIGYAVQGKPLEGDGFWHTMIFDPATDPIYPFTGDGVLGTATNKGVLEHLAFTSTGDVGPYTVYVDMVEQLCEMPGFSPADFNQDWHVDGDDFAIHQACISGPGIALSPGCEEVDLDLDGDIDLSDFGLFQRCMSGPIEPADPDCPF
jgi:hypothetical protein